MSTAVIEQPKQELAKSNGHPQQAQRPIRVVEDNSANACLLDTARFEHMQRIATIMAKAALLPEHLLGRAKKGQETQWYPAEQVLGNCFLIVNQALRWGLDPFAVAAETYVVSGKLGFQGKLIAALVNARANLKERLSYTFNAAKGDALEVTVHGTFVGEADERTVTLTVGQGKTSNDMWTKDPQQKLIYSGATKWARRHCPEVLLGVFTDDDLDRIRDREPALNAKVTRIADVVSAANIEVAHADNATDSESRAESQPPVSHLAECLEVLDNAAMVQDSGMQYVGKNESEHVQYKLANGKVLTVGDGAAGEGSIDSMDSDSVEQVRNELDAARKAKR